MSNLLIALLAWLKTLPVPNTSMALSAVYTYQSDARRSGLQIWMLENTPTDYQRRTTIVNLRGSTC